ncbi:MAG: VOC family protein [Dehalococcoidia bacterium]|jgi:catechol 2,3-dioxygenase|nr:VOC family protein [Dehalococcoidia bacterium]|tara:strand:- start:581 stop:1078 length:498 start_codon:yes stop_codon:yes gene_type:complete
MPRIERVGHTVLNVSDVATAVEFYRDKLGMEVTRWEENPGAFMSFGRQHHDIGLFKARGEHTRGTLGLGHVAFVIEGGTEELKAIHDDLVSKGVEILPMIDYGYTRSFYINDPDGNRIEIYCELLEPLSAKKFMINREGKGKVFEWDEVLDDSGRSDHGVSKLHR